MLERRDFLLAERGADRDREMASGIQHNAAALVARLQATGTSGVRAALGGSPVAYGSLRAAKCILTRRDCDEVLPENWSRRRERKSGKMGGLKGGLSDEKDSIQRGTDRLRIAASGDGDTGGRSNPEDGHLDADVLSMEEAVWPNGCGRNSAIEAAGRGEPEAQAARG